MTPYPRLLRLYSTLTCGKTHHICAYLMYDIIQTPLPTLVQTSGAQTTMSCLQPHPAA